MKRRFEPLLLIAAVTLILPWLAARFASADAGMAACFLLFYAVNPLLALGIGVLAGRRRWWELPVCVAGLSLLGAWLIFTVGEGAFLLYAGIYLVLGWAAMGLTRIIAKER